jgi:hypothetical protein
LTALTANYEGLEQMSLNYSFNGTAKNLIEVDVDGQITELEDKMKASETKETIQGLKNSFIAKAKEKGVKHEDWLKDYADEITFSENLDVDAKVDACLKFYNKSLAVVKTDTTPKQGGGSTDSKLISDIIASAAAQAKAEN